MKYTREQFINKIKQDVINDFKNSKVLPSLTIAQAILESNNGNSGLSQKGNALFGIKAGSNWKGKVYVSKTNEVYNGVSTTITAGFRAYDSWAESIQDHSNLFTSLSRYKNLIGEKDYRIACKKVKEDGYATDPDYTEKLINLIEKNNLFLIDKEVLKEQEKIDTYDEAVKKLCEIGAVNTREYWDNAVKCVNYLNKLLISAANKCTSINKNLFKHNTEGFENAMQKLVNSNVIESPGYWYHAVYAVRYLQGLIINIANRL